MNLYARVTTDGYMLHAASETDYTGSDRYWPDYYSEDSPEADTLSLADVPESLAADLSEQGGSGQVFSDGYEAWQAALPFALDGGASC